MTHRKWMAVAAFCLSLGIWITVAAPSILLAQQADENGQAMNPQPHTKKELKAEKKHEKQELKHNQKADKAAKKAEEHQDKAAYQQEKSANEAAKANQEAQKPN
jgi:stringent starvation protein B